MNQLFLRSRLVAGCGLFLLFNATIPAKAEMNPTGAANDAPYQVRVNGRPVALHQAHTWEPGYVPSYGGPYWFGSFELSGPAQVEVSTLKPLDKLAVLPESSGVTAQVAGTHAVMQFIRPGQVVFEPDGKNGPLLLFANPPEPAPPDRNDPNLKYYGPGPHQAGAIELGDNQTLYLAEGAVVLGGIHARGTNITIRGRGILDGYAYPRFQGPVRYPVLLDHCRQVRVEGIVIKDGWSWTFVPRGCDDVRIENVKLLCCRVENGDGFDIVNSRNVTILNSFVRSDDDCVTPKGMNAAGGQAVENLRVENCILWTDRAHIWRVGCESQAEAMRHFVFKNIDVLHFPDLWTPDEVPFCISLEPAEDMAQENILFEDIRIRTAGQQGLIDARPKVTQWARRAAPGRIQNVIFRNLTFSGPAGTAPGRIRVSGPGPSQGVCNVRFENVTRNGELVTAQSPGVELLGFIEGISFGKAAAARPGGSTSPIAAWKDVSIGDAPQHRPFALVEARKARGVIRAPGGAEGPWQAALEQLQAGLRKSIGTTLPVVDGPAPGLAIILGDSPEAAAEGLSCRQLPPGAFVIKTARTHVLILGNGPGTARGVEVFLAHFAPPLPEGIGTDLVIAPASFSGRREER